MLGKLDKTDALDLGLPSASGLVGSYRSLAQDLGLACVALLTASRKIFWCSFWSTSRMLPLQARP